MKGWHFLPPAAVASGLLAAVVMGGCLVPQDYRFSDDPPPFKNNPVTVVSPDPVGTFITTYNGQGGPTATACQLTFKVSASDPDLDDLLTVRWYVDYDRSSVILQEDLLQNLGSPVRGPVQLTMNLGIPGNPLSTLGPHVVEALVADGQLVNRVPLPRSSDPDAGENPSYVDQHAWVVKTEPGDCP